MTFCLGVKTAQGLVAISDRRITSGSEVSSEKKTVGSSSKKPFTIHNDRWFEICKR